jgi:CDP-glycerol glycerophosphotransferase
MTSPQISVVVPFHNNEDLLGDCLRSIARQTHANLEVIMVDDGSTDGSVEIAKRRAADDPRFILIRVPNGGPGYARNRGIEQATGEFLAFVDADDMLPSHACEVMLHTLQQSGSDFASGGVERIGPMGITPSGMHAQAIKTRRIATHISRTPELFWDVSVWNKMFRKSFWDASHLSFPEVRAWEDLQAMTRAHVLARAVDVIPDPIYYWRERGKGALSITQSRTNIGNFRDRVAALINIDGFLRERGEHRLLREHQRKALVNDLWLYVCDLSRTSGEYQAEFMVLGRRYLDQVGRRVLARLPSTHKLAYHLLGAGQLEQLLEFNAWQADQPIKTTPMVRRLGRIRADIPFREDRRRLKIPGRVYRPYWRELDPFVRVEAIGWHGKRLVITGCAFVPSVDITRRRHASKIIVLLPVGRRRLPIVIPARSFRHDEAATWSAQNRYLYDWAGFRCEISPRWFRVGRRWLTGEWAGYVLVRGHGVWRPARLHTPVRGSAERPGFRQVAPGIRFGAWWTGRKLQVGVTRTPAVLHGCEHAGSELVIDVDVDRVEPGDRVELLLARAKGAATHRFPATASGQAGHVTRVRGAIPLRTLATAIGRADRASTGAEPPGISGSAGKRADVSGTGVHDGGIEWDLYVQVERGKGDGGKGEGGKGEGGGERRMRVAFPDGRPDYRYPAGHQEVVVEPTRYGNAMIVRRGLRPVIDQHAWTDDGRLTLRGSYPATVVGGHELVLRRRSSTEQHVIACQRDGDRFTIEFDAAGMPSFGRRLPLRDGIWDLFLRREHAADGELIVPGYDHARLGDLDDRKLTIGQKSYRFTTWGYDTPMITVGPALKFTEHGRVQRRVLRGVYYPLQQKLPLRDAVVFVSWKGKQCGDNPLAIAQELRRRGDDREHIWAVADYSVPAPDGARTVLTWTEDYFEALARSRYLISNDDMSGRFRKRDGQVYVQTWHGTPLKRIGFDIGQPQFISGASYFDVLREDVAMWDLLLSPNPFSTPIMRRAFRYDGEILESGYPRNDLLRSGDAGRVAADVRRRLGLPAGKRVVLYAPTWRDNQYYASGRYRFDFRLDLEHAWRRLGEDHVFLIRGHHHMAEDVPAGARPDFAVNVTAYPDISELLLVSDVLVTDYSSVMFDFAPTGKPMLFFTYDLEQYRDKLRGFYFDFEAEAPGPLLATSDELVAAIADVDGVASAHRAAYAAFTAKFCPLDDGKAAARACDRIFGG